MSVRVVRGTIGTTPTRIAGTIYIPRAHSDSTRAVVRVAGAVQLGPSDVEWGEGFDLASGEAYTETRDVDGLYAVAESGTVAFQAIVTGDVA